MPAKKRRDAETLSKKEEELAKEWKIWYDANAAHSLLDQADFESLCIGWCGAKGISIDEAFAFYRKMIGLGMF